MANGYHQQSKRQDLAERRNDVKAKARFAEVADALGLISDVGNECPWCFGLTLKACAAGKGCYCDACTRTGDMIDLVEEKLRCGHVKAIEFLEEIIVTKRDTKTGDLFGERSSARSGKSGGGR